MTGPGPQTARPVMTTAAEYLADDAHGQGPAQPRSPGPTVGVSVIAVVG